MRRMTTKIITISSQLLVSSVFLFFLFSNEMGNVKSGSVVVNNDNFNKMADKTLFLFNSLENKSEDVNSNVVVELTSADVDIDMEDSSIEDEIQDDIVEEKKEEVVVTPLEPDYNSIPAIETFTGSLTGYGPDCVGCGGKTSTGFDLWETVYYEDEEYGTIRIVAADKYFPFYSIIRISNVPNMEPFIAIVLDRGGDVGWYRNSETGNIMFDSQKGTLFDLAFATEKDPNILGKTNNVKFEVLRSGK